MHYNCEQGLYTLPKLHYGITNYQNCTSGAVDVPSAASK